MRLRDFLVIVIFIFSTEYLVAQYNGLYFAYTDNGISRKEIKRQVEYIVFKIDSVKSSTDMEFDFRVEFRMYYKDLSNHSKKWDRFKQIFYKEFKKKLGSECLIILSDSIINEGVLTKEDHLFVGSIYY